MRFSTTTHSAGTRQISSWSAVMRDMARRPAPVSFLNPDGSFNLSAIMREAHRHARGIRSLPSQRRRMAVALRVVWGRAKTERLGRPH